MREHRHAHCHVDPRQPRNGTCPGTNPPVFAWKPTEGATAFGLVVARDAGFTNVCLDIHGLADPLHLPVEPLAPGPYWWKWSDGQRESEVFQFEIGGQVEVLEVPSASEWLRRLADGHPRIHVGPDQVDALRKAMGGERSADLERLLTIADHVLAESHHLAEPEFLPDRNRDYQSFWRVWYPIMWGSRAFVRADRQGSIPPPVNRSRSFHVSTRSADSCP